MPGLCWVQHQGKWSPKHLDRPTPQGPGNPSTPRSTQHLPLLAVAGLSQPHFQTTSTGTRGEAPGHSRHRNDPPGNSGAVLMIYLDRVLCMTRKDLAETLQKASASARGSSTVGAPQEHHRTLLPQPKLSPQNSSKSRHPITVCHWLSPQCPQALLGIYRSQRRQCEVTSCVYYHCRGSRLHQSATQRQELPPHLG